MAEFNDEELALGRVYAKAMLDSADKTGATEALAEELCAVASLIDQNAELRGFASSPIVTSASRQLAIEKIFRGKISDLLADSLQVLNRKDRLGFIGCVAEAYRHLLEKKRNRIEAEVTTAGPLSDSLRERLRAALRTRFEKEVDLVEKTDPNLIGGLVVQVGDRKLDASVARSLSVLGDRLLDRASRELHAGTKKYAQAV